MERRLWYKHPANVWEEALPIGNGRIGAMIFGNLEKDIVQVNEESVWAGRRTNRTNKECLKNLPEIRKLLLSGKIQEAEKLMKLAMSGVPKSMPPYQTLGEMDFRFTYDWGAEVTEYVRSLDLSDAVSCVQYKIGGTEYKREVFASYPADVIVLKYTTSEKRKLNFTVNLNRCKNIYDGTANIGNDGVYLYGNLGRGGLEYAMMISLKQTDGVSKVIGDHLIVEEASEAELVFAADCSYHYNKAAREKALGKYHEKAVRAVQVFEEDTEAEKQEKIYQYCLQYMLYENMAEKLAAAKSKTYQQMKEEHIADYQALFGRLELYLGTDAFEALPTDERLYAVKEGRRDDTGLAALYMDFGRYLLISSSRPGGLPANLQGIWNKELTPSWESKYTININTEMNYWLAEKGNLSECHLPLFDLLHKMLPNGKRVAKEMYGCDGFVAHHNTDLYGDCDVQDYWNPGSYWVMGAAWLCTHIWEHYQYTQDLDFLHKHYILLEEAVKFFADFLIEHKGYLVTCPSVSPENTYILPDGTEGANLYAVTMDNQILRDLCVYFIEASEVLGKSGGLMGKAIEILQKLIPTQISEGGYIMEWPEDFLEKNMGHRHISHLYGLHPSEQITMDGTPELGKAARVTLERRLQHGGGHTGWSKAWIINHYAKLWDGELAYQNLLELFSKSTYPNMFDAHPPFQIDGNFGAASGILEMLVQSNSERVVLLPALPKEWPEGILKGIAIKGGATLDIRWENGALLEVMIHAAKDLKLKLRYKDVLLEVECEKGHTKILTAD